MNVCFRFRAYVTDIVCRVERDCTSPSGSVTFASRESLGALFLLLGAHHRSCVSLPWPLKKHPLRQPQQPEVMSTVKWQASAPGSRMLDARDMRSTAVTVQTVQSRLDHPTVTVMPLVMRVASSMFVLWLAGCEVGLTQLMCCSGKSGRRAVSDQPTALSLCVCVRSVRTWLSRHQW
jgi:hypothetical protein